MQGMSQRQIEASTGINDATVARRQAKPEVKAYIEDMHQALITSSLHHSVSNIHHAIRSYQSDAILHVKDDEGRIYDKVDTQLRDHGFKASIKLLEATNILPSQATSIYIQQIFADSTRETPEIIRSLFQEVTHRDANSLTTRSLLQDEPIDV